MENPYRALSRINPQRNWDRRIPTTTFRALLMAGLPGAQYQVVLHIIERTSGFSKESRPISLTEFTKDAHVPRRSVYRAISDLEEQHIIVVGHHREEGTRNEYLFNQYWDTWLTDEALESSVILKGAADEEGVLGQLKAAAGGTMAKNGTSAENGTSAINGTGGVPNPVATSAKNGKGGVPSPRLAASLGKKLRKKGKETLIERDRIFTLWNSIKIIQHKGLTDKRSRAIQAALKHHTVEEICQAVMNYAKVQHGEEYFWDYRWTLEDFLNRGLERFIGEEVEVLANYLKDKGGAHGKQQPRTIRPEAHQRRDRAPTREEYLRSLEK